MQRTSAKSLYEKAREMIASFGDRSITNLEWLQGQMDPYFTITMREEVEAIASLAVGLQSLKQNQRLLLADREKTLILARLNHPGSLYDTLKTLQEREISYAEFTHSREAAPYLKHELEVQRFEFDRKLHREIAQAGAVAIPSGIKDGVLSALLMHYPQFHLAEMERLLELLWLNNENHVRISTPKRIAQLLWLYQQCNRLGGSILILRIRMAALSGRKPGSCLPSATRPRRTSWSRSWRCSTASISE